MVLGLSDVSGVFEALMPGIVLLSEGQAFALQMELFERYNIPGFRGALSALVGLAPEARLNALKTLCLKQQAQVLPKYGFEASEGGVNALIAAIRFHRKSEAVMYLARQINELLLGAIELDTHDQPGDEVRTMEQAPPSSSSTGTELRAPQPEKKANTDADATPTAPAVAPRTTRTRAKYKVIGGADRGGIIVRAEADTRSQQLGRLEHGAIVSQLDYVNDRMRYLKIKGQGPLSGWVSVEYQGMDLLEPLK
eukprot:NODE_6416_length_1674_cov_5.192631.p1 GENE.NODE_6416_length_1674_cov_5.192631~~NODE_6416_length_1674_cov_5.192631.p1  ORF type:complete len:252 (-),score=71.38 NODE_6416_length_1674_cov_5.192631:565-1320(-)